MTHTKDEALKLALEALEFIPESGSMLGTYAEGKRVKAITAIKQARALDKMAENARELGLDYEPAPVQEPVAWMYQCTADNSDPVLLREKQNWAKSGTGLWVETPLYPPPAQPAQQEPVAWLYPEGLEALKAGKCWTAYGTKQDDNCNIPVHLNAAVAPKVEPVKTECDGFDSHPAAPVQPVATLFGSLPVYDTTPPAQPPQRTEQEQGEIERLTAALKKANEQAEHFEREWYLRGDELERLKTTPPAAQRKPLPAHEIVTMYDERPTGDSDMIAFARAIEAAHGIKE